MTLRWQMVELLADGRLRSGESLAGLLGVSRAAIWKQMRRLGDLGLDVQTVRGRGYRLRQPLELLEARRIEDGLSAAAKARLGRLQVLRELDSTNSFLQRQLPPEAGIADFCLAEFQTAGRGRRGRRWLAPFGSGLCLSAAWRFAEQPLQLSALSLVIGVAVHRALRRLGIDGVALKWPNDLLHAGAKLGGILIELRVEAAASTEVVIGLGLNVALPAAQREALAAEARGAITDLRSILGHTPSRNLLAPALMESMIDALSEFVRAGFAPFRDEWLRYDAHAGQPVELLHGERRIAGTARGVDHDGALLLEARGSVQRFVSGDVSLCR